MANEKRLIDANALKWKIGQVCLYVASLRCGKTIISKVLESYRKAVFEEIDNAPTIDAVEVVKYNTLLEMYHELRENFIDYYCSGIPNVAPYCLNRCEECVDHYGWCKKDDEHCKGFNPAEVILMDGDDCGTA